MGPGTIDNFLSSIRPITEYPFGEETKWERLAPFGSSGKAHEMNLA